MINDLLGLNQWDINFTPLVFPDNERKYIHLICINMEGRCKDDRLWFIIDFQVNFLLSGVEILSIIPKYNYIFKDQFSSYLASINLIIYYVWSPFEAYYNIHFVFYNIQGAFPILFNLILKENQNYH